MQKQNPPQIERVEKVKMLPGELRPGMFICELDRPWLESPFPLQGFEVTGKADIQAVARHCKYVYIDLLRSKTVEGPKAQAAPPPPPPEKGAFTKAELKAAQNTRQQTSELLRGFVDEIRLGQSPELEMAKAPVAECVASIISNPEVLMFLTRLRNKDSHVSQNAFNCCVYAIVVGRLLGFDEARLQTLGMCGLLHDIGMLTVPERILFKPGKLTPEEMGIMRAHTTAGREILMTSRNIDESVAAVACGHHENLDGSGYPHGLKGEQIEINSKIVAVVDKYEAITNPRPFRVAGDHLTAVAKLNKMATEEKIDPALTSAFVSYLGIYPHGSVVELNSGELGIVIGTNQNQRLRPTVLLVLDARRKPIHKLLDLAAPLDQWKSCRIAKVHRPSDVGVDVSEYSNLISSVLN